VSKSFEECMKAAAALDATIPSWADLSPDGFYRYSLGRRWTPGEKLLVVIGLNPSTADATQDDPTIRRCVGFAKRWGFGGLLMLNLFAYRATDPEELRGAIARGLDPVGPLNDAKLLGFTDGCPALVAWGSHPAEGRREDVGTVG